MTDPAARILRYVARPIGASADEIKDPFVSDKRPAIGELIRALVASGAIHEARRPVPAARARVRYFSSAADAQAWLSGAIDIPRYVPVERIERQPSDPRRSQRVGRTTCDRVLGYLRSVGAEGTWTGAISRALALSSDAVNAALRAMVDEGLVGAWNDPCERAHNRRRWWASEHRPASAPAKTRLRHIADQHVGMAWRPQPAPVRRTRIEGGIKVQIGPAWTHDPRYQVGPGQTVEGAGLEAVGIGHYTEPATSCAARAVSVADDSARTVRAANGAA